MIAGFMTVVAAGSSGIRRASPASGFVVFVTLLAFVLQSFIAQTHIHGSSLDFAGVAKIAVTQPPTHGKTPSDNGAVDCPFCQAVVHAGALLAPAPPLLLLPAGARYETLFVTMRAIAVASAHSWQSRAPPQR